MRRRLHNQFNNRKCNLNNPQQFPPLVSAVINKRKISDINIFWNWQSKTSDNSMTLSAGNHVTLDIVEQKPQIGQSEAKCDGQNYSGWAQFNYERFSSSRTLYSELQPSNVNQELIDNQVERKKIIVNLPVQPVAIVSHSNTAYFGAVVSAVGLIAAITWFEQATIYSSDFIVINGSFDNVDLSVSGTAYGKECYKNAGKHHKMCSKIGQPAAEAWGLSLIADFFATCHLITEECDERVEISEMEISESSNESDVDDRSDHSSAISIPVSPRLPQNFIFEQKKERKKEAELEAFVSIPSPTAYGRRTRSQFCVVVRAVGLSASLTWCKLACGAEWADLEELFGSTEYVQLSIRGAAFSDACSARNQVLREFDRTSDRLGPLAAEAWGLSLVEDFFDTCKEIDDLYNDWKVHTPGRPIFMDRDSYLAHLQTDFGGVPEPACGTGCPGEWHPRIQAQ